ncbi:hypothetical protein H4R33_003260 [Dimargaris cristalligena]|uniref:C2H2-type domain-containing protein n=1 Tax=Dimargaris cristalligena TaxID=215637 RepID=A0A4Q0A4T1_9FUNG|nr:hypothetical protein H4R33_003260 [Dimargaris cristalligena]RKP40412.1 hypothetical protein BJ085DRAFT_36961 [Dimargaris cristalligena]|eukprot:RKP40412.1 hypothetical protein BJ085DRAFT_36961 [Dimargaris cristalligena]
MAYSTLSHLPTPSYFYDPISSKDDRSKAHLRAAREQPHHIRHHEFVPHSASSSPELPPANFNGFTPLRSTVVCSVCGKKYKHRSCLTKHRWEHHESWETCLKYNLTKHQQVQMMEAAQILVDMLHVAV